MNRFRSLLVVTILSSGLFVGCTHNLPIMYETTDVPPSTVTQLKNITLGIDPFTDTRRSVSENRLVFISGRKTKINETRVCINSEEHYKEEPVASQITTAVSDHFKQRAAFKNIVAGSKESDSVDFRLQGSIRQFYAQQDFSYTGMVASQLGLIGALWIANNTTPGVVRIEFTDLKLADKNGKQVKALGNIAKTFEEKMPASAYCFQPYWRANARLKEVVDILVERVENSLCDIVSASAKVGDTKP